MIATADLRYPSARSPVLAQNVVATSQPLAAQAGVRMLLAGGNAVDAAVAAAIALVVVEPTGNGVGSDAFAIVRDGAGLHGLNASGRAPRRWSPARFAGRAAMPERGWESVTVPGAVAAWADLSRRFGRLAFADLFAPAIGYARAGFLVSPRVAALWAEEAARLDGQPGFRAAFMPGGRAPRTGERVVLPELAETLAEIAATGGESFYRGRLAERIAADARASGAALDADDLAAHRNDWCTPIAERIGGLDVHQIPPNGQGVAALIALGILDRLGISAHPPESAEALHLQIEATKLALADAQAFVGDADHMGAGIVAGLLAPAYLDARAGRVDRRRAQDFGAGAPGGSGTVCLAAADAAGMMVSLIQSNYHGFGSGVVVPGTGIALQNRGAGFTLAPGHPNEVGGGKRPFHTIIPGFATRDGAAEIAFGLMGGRMQAQGHVQLMLRMEVWGQDPQTAADAPRWRVLGGRGVRLEAGFPAPALEALRAMGHEVAVGAGDLASGFGGAQIVRRIDDGYIAGSDPRKDGCAVGY